MGATRSHQPVLRILAAFSRHPGAIEWARDRAEREWGAVALTSPIFDFTQTTYYDESMGPNLKKVFWVYERLIDPAALPEIKLQTNDWEAELKQSSDYSELRPLNLDPGYLTEAKLVLATTKDRDHRIYLDRGIFAEVTLHYSHGNWQSRPWTYPDYQSPEYHHFFDKCRAHLRKLKRTDEVEGQGIRHFE